MLHSLLSHNPPTDVTIHYLHGPQLARDVLGKLEGLVVKLKGQIRFLEIPDEAVAGLQRRGQVAGVMWYRLFLTDRLPQLDRILYLDADTLILDSVRPLWEMDLGDYYAAAVCNVLEPELNHRPRLLGLRTVTDYFNSGVMLMNLDMMRRDRIAQQVLETARRHGDSLMWQDQDPLNMVLAGRWVRLHPRWNCQNSLFYFPHAREIYSEQAIREACWHPAILHFEGPALAKPWHYLCKHPFRRAYREHRSATPWPVLTLEGRTLKNWLLKPLPTRAAIAILKFELRFKRKLTSLAGKMKPQRFAA